jgi:hypothetical protein
MAETKRWEGPPLETWERAWTPDQAAEALAGVAAPWAVAGGWAIDLFLGRQTRDHEDLEIAVPAAAFPEIGTRLEQRGLVVHTVDEGETLALAPGEAPRRGHQTWAADPIAGEWRIDVFREPGDADTWICRRRAELTLPRARATGRTAAGIPYLVPEIVLLFKAKYVRPKDEADLALVLPLMSADAHAWLAGALRRVHPEHPWLERLASAPAAS